MNCSTLRSVRTARTTFRRAALALASASVLGLAACGGGGDDAVIPSNEPLVRRGPYEIRVYHVIRPRLGVR